MQVVSTLVPMPLIALLWMVRDGKKWDKTNGKSKQMPGGCVILMLWAQNISQNTKSNAYFNRRLHGIILHCGFNVGEIYFDPDYPWYCTWRLVACVVNLAHFCHLPPFRTTGEEAESRIIVLGCGPYRTAAKWKKLPSLKLTARTGKWMVGIPVSFWNGLFSGAAMLVSGSVWKFSYPSRQVVIFTHFVMIFLPELQSWFNGTLFKGSNYVEVFHWIMMRWRVISRCVLPLETTLCVSLHLSRLMRLKIILYLWHDFV